jgi:hypothetical protein
MTEELNWVQRATHWARNITPGWKTNVGMLLTMGIPIAKMFGISYQPEPIMMIIDQIPAIVEIIQVVSAAILTIGVAQKGKADKK